MELVLSVNNAFLSTGCEYIDDMEETSIHSRLNEMSVHVNGAVESVPLSAVSTAIESSTTADRSMSLKVCRSDISADGDAVNGPLITAAFRNHEIIENKARQLIEDINANRKQHSEILQEYRKSLNAQV
jgi:hypothetical protein